jgi:hypothetical protein
MNSIKNLWDTRQRALVDRTEDGIWVGRTEWDSPDVDNEVRISVPGDVHLRSRRLCRSGN